MEHGWEFWIDVGGTFTDCMARSPAGDISTHKLLSTGVYRGTVEAGSTTRSLVSHIRTGDPPHFFEGFRLRFLDAQGTGLEQHVTRVDSFDAGSGRLHLSPPLGIAPIIGSHYELVSDEEAPVVGIRWLLGRRLHEPIGACAVRLGTTRATNALLERRGARVGLLITKGFADLLEIGNQDRPRLFDLDIRKPKVLTTRVAEVEEGVDARGNVIIPLNSSSVANALAEFRRDGIEAVAICFKNSYRNKIHEELAAQLVAEAGLQQVSVSSRVSPSQRMVPRCETTVIDAYLTPVIREYVRSIQQSLPEARILLMTSAGALHGASEVAGKDVILSGPAGGVIGARSVAESAGFSATIAFDMGGTSTDVSRQEGPVERRHMVEWKDPHSNTAIRVVAPMLAIETVAAGGGSICAFDGQRVTVGPRSAGADPGPACYAKGGPLTVTDCNLFLGRLVPESFSIPIDRECVESRLRSMAQEILASTGRSFDLAELAEGLLSVANGNMSAAVKRISVARGHDPARHALVSFGGAGGQHACAVAGLLGIRSVVQHRHAGLLSALGISLADIRKFAERHLAVFLDAASFSVIRRELIDMLGELEEKLAAEGVLPEETGRPRGILDLRYRGQDTTIPIELSHNLWDSARGADDAAARTQIDDAEYARICTEFEEAHKFQYGFCLHDRPIEVLVVRVEWGTKPAATFRMEVASQGGPPPPTRNAQAYFDGAWHTTPVYWRDDLGAGARIEGPAIILESASTIVIEPGWQAKMQVDGNLLLTVKSTYPPSHEGRSFPVDAVSLELYSNRFRSIAEEMGVTLQRTAISTNVKERLDFSCALFNGRGQLVVNAPHVPVHLGAMGETIRCLMDDFPIMRPGDVYVTNDPFRGGSHLPDVTVVTPVFLPDMAKPTFFVANRAHHAEIGGILPGSMPPFATKLIDEGVLIPAFRLRTSSELDENRLRSLLTNARWPSRAVEENIADIHAQIAANQIGHQRLSEMVAVHGVDRVQRFMTELQRLASDKMRDRLARLSEGSYAFRDELDDGSIIQLRIDIKHNSNGAQAAFDFSGTSGPSATNLNANPAIVRSAILYSLRCLLGEDIPLNEGVLEPIIINVPIGTLLHPEACADPDDRAAVGGGNVETSQRVVDVVLGALGIAAASQGTMNNVLFGRPAGEGRGAFGYYETICGGAGAGPGFSGASAVHTHMTNTRITDPEVLEARYPVRLIEFSIRRGSGGRGQWNGGDGVVRAMQFLEPVELSIVSNRRRIGPFGLEGGQPGRPGRNFLIRAQGDVEDLGYAAHRQVHANDVLRIETPGGGGCGLENPSGAKSDEKAGARRKESNRARGE